MSVSVAELLVGSNNMFPNTISLDLLPHRDRFKYLTLHDARRSCYIISCIICRYLVNVYHRPYMHFRNLPKNYFNATWTPSPLCTRFVKITYVVYRLLDKGAKKKTQQWHVFTRNAKFMSIIVKLLNILSILFVIYLALCGLPHKDIQQCYLYVIYTTL